MLPKGMTRKALYDDELFNKWFQECFRPKQPSFEKQVERKIIQN